MKPPARKKSVIISAGSWRRIFFRARGRRKISARIQAKLTAIRFDATPHGLFCRVELTIAGLADQNIRSADRLSLVAIFCNCADCSQQFLQVCKYLNCALSIPAVPAKNWLTMFTTYSLPTLIGTALARL